MNFHPYYKIIIIVSVFQLAGKLVGVQNLTLEEDREMQIAVTASNSRIVDGAEEEYPQGLSEIVGVMITIFFTRTVTLGIIPYHGF